MTLDEIAALPIQDIASDDAVLFLWTPAAHLAAGLHLPIIRAWGFKPSSIAFTWHKTLADGRPAVGTGHTTRKTCEFVVLAKRGRSTRRDAGVIDLIVAQRREHSRKPDEFYRRVEQYCDAPRIDLFARESRDGWTTWGDETTKFDEFASRCEAAREYPSAGMSPRSSVVVAER